MKKQMYEILRDYRKLHKIKAKDVAKGAGMSPAGLSMRENGNTSLTLEEAQKIAKYMGLKIVLSFNIPDPEF